MTAHCYRMLGSAFEADDAVQETMVRAWRSIARYEGRGTFEAWLYRIATNVCLNLLRGRVGGPCRWISARPPRRTSRHSTFDPGERGSAQSPTVGPASARCRGPSRRGDRARIAAPGVRHRPATTSAPPTRRCSILRDVLRWSTQEVAELLATTDVSIKSALQRARATMDDAGVLEPTADALDPTAAGLLANYIDAFERYDIDALVALLHHDATMSMPPFDMWLAGAASIEAWWHRELAACRNSRLTPVAANGTLAAAQYRPTEGGDHEPWAIHVLSQRSGRITSLHAFIDPQLFAVFDVPPSWSDRRPPPLIHPQPHS